MKRHLRNWVPFLVAGCSSLDAGYWLAGYWLLAACYMFLVAYCLKILVTYYVKVERFITKC